jgi:hypothetical protein
MSMAAISSSDTMMPFGSSLKQARLGVTAATPVEIWFQML